MADGGKTGDRWVGDEWCLTSARRKRSKGILNERFSFGRVDVASTCDCHQLVDERRRDRVALG